MSQTQSGVQFMGQQVDFLDRYISWPRLAKLSKHNEVIPKKSMLTLSVVGKGDAHIDCATIYVRKL